MTAPPPRPVPLPLQLLYSGFMAVLVPVYLYHYGPTNFFYFCDVAAVLTLIVVWTHNPLLASMALVGIFVPQLLWMVDFFFELSGAHLTGLTGYMFDARRPFYLRFLSFFHFWLPILLVYVVWRLGYDRRALAYWTITAWLLLAVCYLFMPPPGEYADPNQPVNINYVYGFSDSKAQELLPQPLYFALLLVIMPLAIFLPPHLLFLWAFGRRRPDVAAAAGIQ
jgi:hypothetical protein